MPALAGAAARLPRCPVEPGPPQVRQVESITLLSADTPGVYDTTQLAVFPRARTVVGVTGSTSSTSTVASVRCARLWPAAGLSRDSVVSRIRRRLEPSPPALSSDSWYEFCTVPGGCVRINRHDATVDGASSGASAAAGVAALVVGMAAVVVAAGTGR